MTVAPEKLKPKPEPCAKFEVHGSILAPRGTVKVWRKMQRMPFKSGKPVALRIVVDIQVKAALNMTLWAQLKLPPGWRKCPRLKWKNDNHFPVRIYTYEPRSLSAEELENIQAQILLMEGI
jgi:hypothetical protein